MLPAIHRLSWALGPDGLALGTEPAGSLHEQDGIAGFVTGTIQPSRPSRSYAEQVVDLYRGGGLESLSDLGGSYAAVIADSRDNRVHLVTDLFGSYSLYYARKDETWYGGTSLGEVARRIGHCTLDEAALAEAICFRFFAASNTLVKEVRQVPPGSIISLAADGSATETATRRLGSFVGTVPTGSDGVRALDEALCTCLEQVRARHPSVTVFLSGGVDSSLLLAKVLEAGFDTVRCCTAVFPGWSNPELPLARRAAKHLNTPLEEIVVSENDVQTSFEATVLAMEEPPRHYKIFALWKLYEYAARHAPLVVSGIGAENVFGPKSVKWLRPNMRRLGQLRAVPRGVRRRLASMIPRTREGRLALLRNLCCCESEEDLFAFLLLCDERLPHTSVARGLPEVPSLPESFWRTYIAGLPTLEDRQQVYALLTEDKPDMQSRARIGGAHGVDTVHPFLSLDALRLGLGQVVEARSKDGWSKPLVRELACRYFPREWIYTEKFGFPTPLPAWMTGPLRPRLDALDDGHPAVVGLWRRDVLRDCRTEGNFEMLWGAMTAEFLLRRFLPDSAPRAAGPPSGSEGLA